MHFQSSDVSQPHKENVHFVVSGYPSPPQLFSTPDLEQAIEINKPNSGHRQEKNKFDKEDKHTPERSLRVLGPWIHSAPRWQGKDSTDGSLRYRGTLGGSLLQSRAQISRGACQSSRDRDRGISSSVREAAALPTDSRQQEKPQPGKLSRRAGSSCCHKTPQPGGSNSRLSVLTDQEAGRSKSKVLGEASLFADGHLAGAAERPLIPGEAAEL